MQLEHSAPLFIEAPLNKSAFMITQFGLQQFLVSFNVRLMSK
jgi:hypothetical protein